MGTKAKREIMLKKIRIFFFLFLFGQFSVIDSLALTRDSVITTASSYANYNWYCSASNANSTYNYFIAGATYTGVAYNWGGFDTLSQFQSKINSGAIAGDSKIFGVVHSDFAGVDCSGFVSRCWGLSSKYSTSTLPSISTAISWEDLKAGDITNLAGSHVRLFHNFTDGTNQMMMYEATVPPSANPARVVHRIIPRDNSYTPRRYNDIEEPISPPTVETRPATSISETGAILNGRIFNDGGSSIIERRFDWGTTSDCSDGWTASVSVSGNYFSYYLSGLNAGRTYYFRAWAKNSAGWSHGDVLSFTTSSPQTLSVSSFTANPSSGTAPLNGVDLTATVSGTATGTINYTFYANRSDDGTNITPDYCFKINGRNPDGTGGTVIYQGIATGWTGGTTFTVYDVYNYTFAGTYTAKVIAERGSAPPAEKRVTITVSAPPTISVTPASRDFGSVQVGSYSDLTFTVQNAGGGTLTGSASVPSPFTIFSGGSYSLTAGQSQVVTVRFSPTAAQSYNGTVTFTGGGGATRPVSGTGLLQKYTITATFGENGTVEPNGVFDVNLGQDVTFTAEPNAGYIVDWWYLDGSEVQQGSTTYTLYNVQADHNVLVTFIEILPMDLNNDGILNFSDFAIFAFYWMDDTCSDSDWCEGSDSDYSGRVDFMDLLNFVDYWLWCRADLDLDGAVNFTDYAIFAYNWMDDTCCAPNWCEGTDFDHSGSVDMLDLATFARYWLEGI